MALFPLFCIAFCWHFLRSKHSSPFHDSVFVFCERAIDLSVADLEGVVGGVGNELSVVPILDDTVDCVQH